MDLSSVPIHRYPFMGWRAVMTVQMPWPACAELPRFGVTSFRPQLEGWIVRKAIHMWWRVHMQGPALLGST